MEEIEAYLVGEVVQSEVLVMKQGENNTTLSLENFESGVYFLEIKTSEGIARKKLELIK